MGLPWQADTAFCRAGYDTDYDLYQPTFWPARVPNHVLTDVDYAIVIDAAQPRARRLEAFLTRTSWVDPLQGDTVAADGADGPRLRVDGAARERGPACRPIRTFRRSCWWPRTVPTCRRPRRCRGADRSGSGCGRRARPAPPRPTRVRNVRVPTVRPTSARTRKRRTRRGRYVTDARDARDAPGTSSSSAAVRPGASRRWCWRAPAVACCSRTVRAEARASARRSRPARVRSCATCSCCRAWKWTDT